MFIDIQTSKALIQMDTNKMMTYEIFTMNAKKNPHIIKIEHNRIGSALSWSGSYGFDQAPAGSNLGCALPLYKSYLNTHPLPPKNKQ